LADLVTEEGNVEGVDISQVMIGEARARAGSRENICFRTGIANGLPYENAIFDATRMERVLLYVPDREAAITEMVRVTKTGGRVVVADVDFDAVATFATNRSLTCKMTSLIADTCVHPLSGRELPYLLKSVGLRDISVEFGAVSTSYEFCVYVSNAAAYPSTPFDCGAPCRGSQSRGNCRLLKCASALRLTAGASAEKGRGPVRLDP
jgi:SAM-dependent methyltransferase